LIWSQTNTRHLFKHIDMNYSWSKYRCIHWKIIILLEFA
jgi:hypothetical protein